MTETSALSLGTRDDATYWSSTCTSELSFNAIHKITNPVPTLQSIKDFFSGSEEWLFLAGHFTRQDHLYNERATVKIKFQNDRIVIDHPDASGVKLVKGEGFQQHKNVKVLFWGGCDVHSDNRVVETMRKLFDSPVMIGWRGTTGWEILNSVMGGFGNTSPHSSRDFFSRVKSRPSDSDTVKNAWLNTAKDTTWGSTTPTIESRFSVIMPNGTEYRIV